MIGRGAVVKALWILNGRPTPTGPISVFFDVPESSPYRRATDWASSIGVVRSLPDGSFRPTAKATRASVAVWSFRAIAGGVLPPGTAASVTTDIPPGTERADAVSWALAYGLLTATTAGAFRPSVQMPRRTAVKMLWTEAGAPEAWDPALAGTAILSTASGWWDTAAWDGSGGRLPDLSGGDQPLVLHDGGVGPPVVLGYDADPRQYLYHPGWDDMILDTPDPPTFPTGDFDFRIDADLTPELATATSPENFVFHQGAAGDASLAVSFHEVTGAPTLWYSTDGTNWQTTNGAPPSIGVGPGRRGIRFVADDGAGGHRVEFFEQAPTRPPGDIEQPFDSPAWQLVDTVSGPGTVLLHDSAREVAMSSGHDRIFEGHLANGWGRVRRMTLRSPAGTAFDLDPTTIVQPLEWSRSGPIPGDQHCWCTDDDTAGPAKDASFSDSSGAMWTIHNWQTGSTPIAVVDRPAVLLGNNARLTTAATEAFDPGPDGLSVVLSYRWTRTGISGSYLFSSRVGSINQGNAGWGSLATAYLCCGPAFAVSDGTTLTFARSPIERDGAVVSTVGVLDRTGGFIQAYTSGVPGDPVAVSGDVGVAPDPLPFSIGGDPDHSLHAYGGFEFFGAAVFTRPLSGDEVDAVDAQFANPDRNPNPTTPAAVRFG